MVTPIGTILIKKPEAAFLSQEHLNDNYERFNYLGLPVYSKVLKEYQTFEGVIKANVENILYLPQNDITGLDSIYTHDSLKVTKHGAIYMNMGKDLRIKESKATEDFLISQGVPTLGKITGDGRMEGGDVVWIDEKTVAIGLGYRTNDEGVRQFKEIVKDFVDDVIVVPMPHGDGRDACLHLMSIISMVDTNLAVVYSKYMPVFFRCFLIDRDIELLEVDDDEYDNLGSNVLALAPRKCLMLKGNPNIKEKLLNAGVTVFEYSGDDLSYKGTGGPTCLTCPILRG